MKLIFNERKCLFKKATFFHNYNILYLCDIMNQHTNRIMDEERIQQITQSTNVISNWTKGILTDLGIGGDWMNYINTAFMILIQASLVFVVYHITRYILRGVFKKFSAIPRMSFLKHLYDRRFPHYLSMIIPFSLVKGSIPIVLEAFPQLVGLANKMADMYLVFYVIWLVMSVINAFGDSLRIREQLKDKPIDSYIQVVRIIFYFFGFIILFSILTGKNPMYFIGGLGAASAILMLIFKDTIMGFVASIQVSANDMVRIGDWITMPKYDADGDVIQITLTTVKIRNFDKTITTIPPYALVSDSFQNWRGMQEVGGRRLKRSVFVKQSSIKFIEEEELPHLMKIQSITQYISERTLDIDNYNHKIGADKSLSINGRNLTNMGLYRAYIQNYLKQHPGVHKDMISMVRQLQPISKGLPLELYFFTATTAWLQYEDIVSDVFDHVTAAAKYFDIELFEDVSNPIMMSQDK